MPIKVLGPTHDRHPKNTRRENRLEELGRVDAEKAHTQKGKRNLREEKDRIIGELGHGVKNRNRRSLYKKAGGLAGAGGAKKSADTFLERVGGSEKGKPHSTKEGRMASGKRKLKRFLQQRGEAGTAQPDPERPRGKWKKMPWYPGEKPKWKNLPWKPGKKPKMQPLKKGGKAKDGLSPAQSHYLQHGYGPHKRDGKAFGGVIKAVLIKGKPKIAKKGWK
jgi:hypothetical protein